MRRAEISATPAGSWVSRLELAEPTQRCIIAPGMVIMILPVIGKNLMLNAYIHAAAWVACKVPRAAHTLTLQDRVSSTGVRDAKFCAHEPRR